MCFFFFFFFGFFFFFFFSSRRRHTRSLRDWSSDVCSSDLIRFTCGAGLLRRDRRRELRRKKHSLRKKRSVTRCGKSRNQARPAGQNHCRCERSEERRVGKECRSRWSPEHEKTKSNIRRIEV